MNGPGRQETWQRLLGLESRDVVQIRFRGIHSRELNARRAGEINAAARQAREYFRNAAAADYSVRPLLTFYGIACLSRALLLLMNPNGGEECLTQGHGLETRSWQNVMKGSIAADLTRLGDLKIRRCAGFFSDFLKYTRNATLIHKKSAAVDGHCAYDEPDLGVEISLEDLLSRSPDLRADHASIKVPQYAIVHDFSYSADKGLEMKFSGDAASEISSAYRELGYLVAGDAENCTVTCDKDTLLKEPPMFVHDYVQKMLGSIPVLRLAVPFPGRARFSQLCITYMISYVLGMLVRYYPTHWISLINGGKGDLLWPTINRAQQYVEVAYPELVAEYVTFAMDNPAWVAKGVSKS